MKSSPYKQGIAIWVVLITLFFIGLMLTVQVRWELLFLVSVNAATFFLYALDKHLAIRRARRIPEYILYLTAFAGGAIGALAAMQIFRHKTAKISFQFTLALLILVEIGLVIFILDPSLFMIGTKLKM